MKNSILVFAALLGLSALAAADSSGRAAPRLATLASVIEEARAHNPDLVAARKLWESMQARVTAARTWPNPTVAAEWMGFSRSGLNVSSAEEKWYSVGQQIPFPGKLYWKGKAAEHEALRERGMFEGMEREILSKVKQAYFELLYAERAVQIVKENVEIMRRFAKIAESKYGTGKASQSDALRAQTELSKMLNMSVTADQERETVLARLNSLLDRHPEGPVTPAQGPQWASTPLSFEQLEGLALQNRPEIGAARHHATHLLSELSAMRADYLPDLEVEYTWRTREGMHSDARAMVKLDLPFVWFWRQRSLVRSAAKERENADAAYRSAIAMTRYEVKEFLTHVQASRRLVELYQTTILPQAEQSLKVAESAYQSGRVGFLDLLDSQRAWLDFQLEYHRSVSEYGINMAHLERVVGQDLLEVQSNEK